MGRKLPMTYAAKYETELRVLFQVTVVEKVSAAVASNVSDGKASGRCSRDPHDHRQPHVPGDGYYVAP